MPDIKKRLRSILKNIKNHRIVVAGDMVLDQFWYGRAQRLSREAPIPIISLDKTMPSPGCAANTVANIASLGAIPLPVGAIGEDEAGENLIDLYRKHDITTDFLVKSPFIETPTKIRILAGSLHTHRHQIARVDRQNILTDREDVRKSLKKSYIDSLKDAEAIIFSDYGLKIATFLFSIKKPNIITAVDSRFELKNFKGCTFATPNEEEAELASGIPINENPDNLERVGIKILESLSLSSLLLTRGQKGIALFEPDRKRRDIPIFGSSEVVDVTGAGDTVMAVAACSKAAGATFFEAALLSNIAGGVVVGRQGTATITPPEIDESIEEWDYLNEIRSRK